jgi:hypothetical protein
MNTETWLDYFLVAFATLLPFGVIKYLIREKYARQVLLRNQTEKERVVKSSALILKLTRLFLVSSPLILIYLAPDLYKDSGVDLLRSIALSVLLLITVGLEYMFHKWLQYHLGEVKLQE